MFRFVRINLKVLLFTLCLAMVFSGVLFRDPVHATVNSTLNFQGKIVVKTTGVNLTAGNPTCIIAGAGNDTCDFRVRIWNVQTSGTTTAGTNLLYEELFNNVELGAFDGVFNLSLNSVCQATANGDHQWGTTVASSSVCNLVDDSDADSITGVNFGRTDLWMEISFDPSGTWTTLASVPGGTEAFTRKAVTSAPSALVAGTLDGIGPTGFVQVGPSASQSTTTTNTLIDLNETGGGTPDLLKLSVGGNSVFKVDNTGNIQVGSNSANGSINLGNQSNNVLGTSTGAGAPSTGLYWGNLQACLSDGSGCPGALEITLTNNSGSTLNAGDLVIRDTTSDSGFKTTTTANDEKVLGVLSASCAASASCKVKVQGITSINSATTVNRGEYLYSSTTAAQATSQTASTNTGLIGVALSSDTSAPYTPQILIARNYGSVLSGVYQDTTLGSTSTDSVNLTIYGDILQGGNTEITSLTNANDIFIYDTTTDSDQGNWTSSLTGNSWYTESKDDGVGDTCNISTDDRCGKSYFPKKAVVVATDSAVYIFDGNSNDLWMKFTQSSGYALSTASNNVPTTVTAIDGSVFIGFTGSSSIGMLEINFKTDQIATYSTAGKTVRASNIANRNSSQTSTAESALVKSKGSYIRTGYTYNQGCTYTSIGFDSSNNVFLMGNNSNNCSNGVNNPDTVSRSESSATEVLKVDSNGNYVTGNVLESSTATSNGTAVDSSGNLWVVGTFSGTVSFGGTNKTSGGGNDIFIAKYNSSLVFQSVTAFGGSGDDSATNIKFDSSGNIFLFGTFSTTVDFDPGAGTTSKTSNGGTDGFIEKFDSSLNFTWVNTFGGSGSETLVSAAIGPSDSPYAAGTFTGTVDFDPSGGTDNKTGSGTALYTTKNTNAGAYQWTDTVSSGGTDKIGSVTVAADGNVYLGLYFGGGDLDPTGGTDSHGTGAYISNYTNSGGYGSSLAVQTNGTVAPLVTTDASSSIYVAGEYSSTGTVDFDPTSGLDNQVVTNAGSYVTKLWPNFVYQWSNVVETHVLVATNHYIGVDSAYGVYFFGPANGGDVIDFDPTSGTETHTGIASSGPNYLSKYGGFTNEIIGNQVNQISSSRASNDYFVAVATNNGVSLYDKTRDSMLKVAYNYSSNYSGVGLTGSTLVAYNQTSGQLENWTSIDQLTSDQLNSATSGNVPAVILNGSSAPAINEGTSTTTSAAAPTASSSARVSLLGIDDWTNTGNTFASDNTYATAVMSANEYSNYVVARGFGFSLPANSTVLGIAATIERKGSVTNDFRDASVKLYDVTSNGFLGSIDHADLVTNYTNADVVKNYGGSTDTWGVNLTESMVNTTGFGIALAVHCIAGSGVTVSVDQMTMTITYADSVTGTVKTQSSSVQMLGTKNGVTEYNAKNNSVKYFTKDYISSEMAGMTTLNDPFSGGTYNSAFDYTAPSASDDITNHVDIGPYSETDGPNAPTGESDNSSVGTVTWTNPANSAASDNVYATAAMTNGTTSHYLLDLNWGFTIPNTAVIRGVQVTVERSATVAGLVSDSGVYLKGSGSVLGNNRAQAGTWGTGDTVITYGGDNDTWGATLTPNGANGPGGSVGVAISVTSTGTSTARIDAVTMKVFYVDAAKLPTYVSGVNGTGLSFDGSDIICSNPYSGGVYTLCADDDDLDVVTATTDAMTLSAWFKHPSEVTATETILAKGGNGTTDSLGYAMWITSSGFLECGIDNDNTTFPEDSVTGTTRVDDGKWHFATCVKDPNQGSNSSEILYLDGAETGTRDAALSSTGTLANTDPLYIGSNRSQTELFNGIIDEVMVSGTVTSPSQIRTMYNTGKQAYLNGHDEVTDATTFSSTTIGDTGETWGANQFVNQFVEITGGTGAGQTRKIASNTTTVLTVTTAWATTPDATSDFKIRPEQLYGSTNTVKSMALSQRGSDTYLYVGTNDGSNGGGVSVINLSNDGLADVYHGSSGKTDEGGTSWGSTYDNIRSVAADSKVFAAGSDNHYWFEFNTISLIDKIDNAANNPSILKSIDDSGSVVKNQVIRSGVYNVPTITAACALTQVTTIPFGMTFDDTPVVVDGSSQFGTASGGTTVTAVAERSYISEVTPSGFTLTRFETITAGTTCALGALKYQWLAIGSYSQAGGADLAENYLTYDKTTNAGDVVGIDPNKDVSVIKTRGAMDSSAIGVVATQPQITLGPDDGSTPGVVTSVTGQEVASGDAKTVPVALAGRVPVKVTLENGPVKRGDFLTPASKPGFAMKAVKPGITIGRALEEFNGNETVLGVLTPNADPTEDAMRQYLKDSQTQTDKLTADNLAEGKVMTFIQPGYFWGVIGGNGLSDPLNQQFTTNGDPGLGTVDIAGTLDGASQYLQFMPNSADGRSFILGGLLFGKKDSSINSKDGTLNLQDGSASDVNLFGGKVVVSSDGSIKASSITADSGNFKQLTVQELNIKGNLSGTVEVRSLVGTAEVKFDQPLTDYVVTITPLDENSPRYFVVKSDTGFKVQIETDTANTDDDKTYKFDYLVIKKSF